MSEGNPLRDTKQLRIVLTALPAAFGLYFCMYAFRKPFTVGTFGGDDNLFIGELTWKSVFVLSQILGYLLSKYIGTKICSETHREQCFSRLLIIIFIAQLSLILFGILPGKFKAIAMLLNGIPIGMVWGIVVRILEGRRVSEILLAGLCCSFIVASGWVKSVGDYILQSGVDEYWMPAIVGAIFLLPFYFFARVLHRISKPDALDIKARKARPAMEEGDKSRFIKTFLPGLLMVIITYTMLTAYRDFRDIFQKEMFVELDYDNRPEIFAFTETIIAIVVTVLMLFLFLIKNNRLGLIATFTMMLSGIILLAGATYLLELEKISGMAWMIVSGLGAYLAYVPFNAVFFDRLIAYSNYTGTAVFAIYLCDACGYTGSFCITLWKDLFAQDSSRLEFFITFNYMMVAISLTLLVGSMVYFLGKKNPLMKPVAA